MTPRAYRLALALFGLSVVGGAFGLTPAPHELGLVEPIACETWLEAPREGHFELTDCEIDLRDPYDESWIHEQTRARVQRPGDALRSEPPRTRLWWQTDAPRLVALSERVERDLSGTRPHRRTLERYHDQLVQTRTLAGEIERQESAWVMTSPEPTPFGRAFAIVLLAFGALGLLVLVPLARRWRRRERELGAHGAEPLRF